MGRTLPFYIYISYTPTSYRLLFFFSLSCLFTDLFGEDPKSQQLGHGTRVAGEFMKEVYSAEQDEASTGSNPDRDPGTAHSTIVKCTFILLFASAMPSAAGKKCTLGGLQVLSKRVDQWMPHCSCTNSSRNSKGVKKNFMGLKGGVFL